MSVAASNGERELQLRREWTAACVQLQTASRESDTAYTKLLEQQAEARDQFKAVENQTLFPLQTAAQHKELLLRQHIGTDGFVAPGTKLRVAITQSQHPLLGLTGCLDALYNRPGCPFASHQGHIDVIKHGLDTHVEIEAWHTSEYQLRALPWTKYQLEMARSWLTQEIAKLANEPASACPVTPFQKSIFRHPRPVAGDW